MKTILGCRMASRAHQVLIMAAGILFSQCLAVNTVAASPCGKVAQISGSVQILNQETDTTGQEAKVGTTLSTGQVVKTSADGGAKLLFEDQTIMDVGPSSAFKIQEFDLKNGDNRVGVFSLIYGKLRGLVTRKVSSDGRYEFRARQAVMGVRGTEWVMEAPFFLMPPPGTKFEPPPASFAVVSGTVTLAPLAGGPPVFVNAGQFAVGNTALFAAAAAAATGKAPGPSGSGGASGKGASGTTDTGKPTEWSGTPGTRGTPGTEGRPGGSPDSFTPPPALANIVQLNPEQMQGFLKPVKLEDRTFVAAVDFSGAAAGGARTDQMSRQRELVRDIMTSRPLPPPQSETGTAGPPKPPTFIPGPTAPIGPPPLVAVGNRVHISVVVQ